MILDKKRFRIRNINRDVKKRKFCHDKGSNLLRSYNNQEAKTEIF